MEKILVTGATGFTGSRLSARLLNSGMSVRALVREESNYRFLRDMGAEIFRGDITDRAAVFEAARGADTVFHVAAAFREARLPDRVYRDVNVEGTRNVLDACLMHGARRLVHCSTIGVYGDVLEMPADEETPFNPGDIYQETKLEGELLAIRYFREKSAPVVIIRPCGIYGPGDMRFLKLFRSIARKRFVMLGDGLTPWHPVYIDNLVDSFLLCAEKEKAPGEAFIIGDESYLSLNELIKNIASALEVPPPRVQIPAGPVRMLGGLCESVFRPLGLEPPLHRRRVDFFTKARAFDISKAKKLLGYSPGVDLDTGLKLTADWYKKEGLL